MVEQPRKENFQDLLRKVEAIITNLQSIQNTLQTWLGDETFAVPQDWLQMRLKVWAALHKRDDLVEYRVFRDITEKVGYDPRGIGGFFTGKNPSIVHVGENKVAIASWAIDKLKYFSEWLKNQIIP